MKFHPLGNKVLILNKKAEEKTSGGIIVVTSQVSSRQFGTIVEVGPNVMEPFLKPGVVVFYDKMAAMHLSNDVGFESDSDAYTLVNEEDIFGYSSEE